jgi:hypothetical protein
MQDLELFEEDCNNSIRAMNDARSSNDYGCCSINYLLHLIDKSVNNSFASLNSIETFEDLEKNIALISVLFRNSFTIILTMIILKYF